MESIFSNCAQIYFGKFVVTIATKKICELKYVGK